MKCIVCDKPGQFSLIEKPTPTRKSNEVLVKIKRIGICGTDLHAYAGNQPFFSYPRILGHELSGEVYETDGTTAQLTSGDKVLIMPYISCGTCSACSKGKTNCCEEIAVLGVHTDGGMQELFSLPAELLVQVNELSYEEIAIVEPLAIGAHAVRRAGIEANDKVVVVGCGPIGIGIMVQAQLRGAHVIALDVEPSRLAFVKEKMGISSTVLVSQDSIAHVREIFAGALADVVFDATGNKKALETGTQYMGHGGKYVLVGLYKDTLSLHHPSLHAKETSLLCSRNATREDFDAVVKMLVKGDFPSDDFISHRVPFDHMIEKFESWLDPANGVIKAMVSL